MTQSPTSPTGASASGVSLRLLTERDRENEFRQRLGLLAVGERLAQRTLLWGWLGPILMAGIAAVLRLINLGHPDRIMFDETYYVKDAFTLDIHGYATRWEPEDEDDRNQYFNVGDYREMTDTASYVVHGDLGKWFIALGMRLFASDNPFGWRFAAAIAGILCVLLVGRIAMRIFRSAGLATLAAGLLAIDGNAITLSRIGLLDVFLAALVLAGFWAVLKDRDASRATMARRLSQWRSGPLGPATGFRGWLILAGILLGASAGVKWSGFYAAAVLGLAAWLWDLNARQLLRVRHPIEGSVVRGGIPAFLALVPATIAAYLASWFSWFTHEGAYMRQWAANERARGHDVPRDWLPDSLNSFIEYHLQILSFHSGLDTPHTYEAHPLGWLIQLRPTSFYWQEWEDQDQIALCGAERCVGAITSQGNPFIWWSAAIALVLVIWMAVKWRDARAGIILTGYAATYLPWFIFMNRTVFQFYTVVIGPFVVLALAYAIGMVTQRLALAGTWDPEALDSRRYFRFPYGRRARRRGLSSPPDDAGEGSVPTAPAAVAPDDEGAGSVPTAPTARWRPFRRLAPPAAPAHLDPRDARTQRIGMIAASVIVALAVIATIFWWPILTGMVVPYDFWRFHMWFPTWV
ncbi:MAG: phospholipid carrier-dependent glycosyltransferase [bacterium]|nr:phospholipid carrier-dependent glycosyltransferase [bacterium]